MVSLICFLFYGFLSFEINFFFLDLVSNISSEYAGKVGLVQVIRDVLENVCQDPLSDSKLTCAVVDRRSLCLHSDSTLPDCPLIMDMTRNKYFLKEHLTVL